MDNNRNDKKMQEVFLQSREWEVFQKNIGRKTWRINNILVIGHNLPAGFNYLYCPRLDFSDERRVTSDEFFYELKNIALAEKSIFLKIDPAAKLQIADSLKGEPRAVAKLRTSESIQPQKTTILDLQKPESEILSQMHEKTRYNIRLAERRGVQIASDKLRVISDKLRPISYFDKFWRLLQETAKRDGFYTHEERYYEKLLDMKSENFYNELFIAEYQGKILAAAIVNFYGDTATYLHGASSSRNREVMAPHLLHWRLIQEAIKRGFAKYDFWGIDEKKWPGVTRFKLGFGGEVVEYPSSVDIIYRPVLYKIYRLAKKLR